jgi:hypothetical protein
LGRIRHRHVRRFLRLPLRQLHQPVA